ncbi:hypothetical protein PG988_006843 [Apiospora saccharicola]
MDRLPPELKIPIMQQVMEESPPGIAGVLAAVSREWQALIEPTSLYRLMMNQERLIQTRKTLTLVRQSYVRYFIFIATLPTYDPEDPETETERRQNNEVFSDAVVGLLGFLSPWISGAVKGFGSTGIILVLGAACPTDEGRLDPRLFIRRKDIRDDPELHDWVVDLDPRLCPAEAPDEISVALAALSMRMETVCLEGVIGQEFWSALAPEEEEEEELESEEGPKDGDNEATFRPRPHHRTSCRLRELAVFVHSHTPQGVFLLRYDPKLDSDVVKRDQPGKHGRMKNQPPLEIDPDWEAAVDAARRRLPGMDISAGNNEIRYPASLTYPNGPGCGAFTRTIKYVDEDGMKRY